MVSIEKELDLDDGQSDSSYFDYFEEKLSGTTSRAKVVDSKKRNTPRAQITENAKFWKEFAGS